VANLWHEQVVPLVIAVGSQLQIPLESGYYFDGQALDEVEHVIGLLFIIIAPVLHSH